MKRNLCVLLCMVMIFGMASSFAVFGADELLDSAKLVLSTESKTLNEGDIIILNVGLEEISSKQFISGQIALYFDPDVFEVVDKDGNVTTKAKNGFIESDNFYDENEEEGYGSRVSYEIDNAKGLVMYAFGRHKDSPEEFIPCPDGTYTIVQVRLKVKQEKGTSIQFAIMDESPDFFDTFPYGYKMNLGNEETLAYVTTENVNFCQVTVTNNGGNGSLLKNGVAVKEKEIVAPDTYSYQVVAEEGYEVDSVTVTSGETTLPITLNANNEFDVAVLEDIAITVSFCRVGGRAEIITDDTILSDTVIKGEQSYQARLAFATIKNLELIDSYGMYLNFPGGSMKLEGFTDEATMKMMEDSNGKFAFRVFGDALKGKTITLLPYITEDGNESFGEETEEITYE